MSIMGHVIWPRIIPHLVVTPCGDGSIEPRHRIEFLGLPDALGREASFIQMPCVCCGRPINPLRRRVGDAHDRLYYACTCLLNVRIACSRGGEARLEYERREQKQLSMF